ncbi:hypothetical protein B0H11DRAFT_2193451 [Mycena galericulata]|nr:hypothetical protein B0H11DRAFT_2193451 [Mycena galericulata]
MKCVALPWSTRSTPIEYLKVFALSAQGTHMEPVFCRKALRLSSQKDSDVVLSSATYKHPLRTDPLHVRTPLSEFGGPATTLVTVILTSQAQHTPFLSWGRNAVIVGIGSGHRSAHLQDPDVRLGVDALSAVLAVEEGPHGVRSNVVAPGPIGGTEGVDRIPNKAAGADSEAGTWTLPSDAWAPLATSQMRQCFCSAARY